MLCDKGKNKDTYSNMIVRSQTPYEILIRILIVFDSLSLGFRGRFLKNTEKLDNKNIKYKLHIKKIFTYFELILGGEPSCCFLYRGLLPTERDLLLITGYSFSSSLTDGTCSFHIIAAKWSSSS